jgi:single-strand DNA-binding protein
VIRQTRNGTPVANFSIASNRKFRNGDNQWQEDVCYVGVVAWNKLAESCADKLRKGSAVLVEGELQSRMWQSDDGSMRSTVEIKARRIQFLNKRRYPEHHEASDSVEEEHFVLYDCEDDSFFSGSDDSGSDSLHFNTGGAEYLDTNNVGK